MFEIHLFDMLLPQAQLVMIIVASLILYYKIYWTTMSLYYFTFIIDFIIVYQRKQHRAKNRYFSKQHNTLKDMYESFIILYLLLL